MNGPFNQTHEVKAGDRVFVDAAAHNIGDSRPIVGVYPVVDVYPNHAAGPCFYVEDEQGATAVRWESCMTLDYIRDLPQALAHRDARISALEAENAKLRAEVERLRNKAESWDRLVYIASHGQAHAVSVLSGYYQDEAFAGKCGFLVNINGLDHEKERERNRVSGDYWGETPEHAIQKAAESLKAREALANGGGA